uniref:Uncharacterized protein n=1 Tax=Oryza rufipogon TaxID=4529 RepID=A0A0E0RK74_ORYRU
MSGLLSSLSLTSNDSLMVCGWNGAIDLVKNVTQCKLQDLALCCWSRGWLPTTAVFAAAAATTPVIDIAVASCWYNRTTQIHRCHGCRGRSTAHRCRRPLVAASVGGSGWGRAAAVAHVHPHLGPRPPPPLESALPEVVIVAKVVVVSEVVIVTGEAPPPDPRGGRAVVPRSTRGRAVVPRSARIRRWAPPPPAFSRGIWRRRRRREVGAADPRTSPIALGRAPLCHRAHYRSRPLSPTTPPLPPAAPCLEMAMGTRSLIPRGEFTH